MHSVGRKWSLGRYQGTKRHSHIAFNHICGIIKTERNQSHFGCVMNELFVPFPNPAKSMPDTLGPRVTMSKYDVQSLSNAITIYKTPDATMVGFLLYVTLPLPLPVASRALTTFNDSSSATSPKTTCLPSSQLVTTVVMKNWEPLL